MSEVSIENYRGIAPSGAVDFLYQISKPLKGKKMLHVNSTSYGGGVAEMLQKLIPLFQNLGINARWEVIEGNQDFFATTKAFHNTLQGKEQEITEKMLQAYIDCNAENAKKMNLDCDVAIIHDPQPAALVDARKTGKWIWRFHPNISKPVKSTWEFLSKYVEKYDASIYSLPEYAQRLNHPQFLIYPSIDPLSDKNRELSEEEVKKHMEVMEIPTDKPILLQVSRFDRFKDPIGVIQAYKKVKSHNDCRLVLVGGAAADDPEGAEVLAEVKDVAGDDSDIHLLTSKSDVEVNALQTAATIVFQKSTSEGFGLTVSEAMWKSKPVIGGRVGGITTQLLHDMTGYTVDTVEGAAFYARYLLNNPTKANEIGQRAKEYVRSNFLVTRHLGDYMALMSLMS